MCRWHRSDEETCATHTYAGKLCQWHCRTQHSLSRSQCLVKYIQEELLILLNDYIFILPERSHIQVILLDVQPKALLLVLDTCRVLNTTAASIRGRCRHAIASADGCIRYTLANSNALALENKRTCKFKAAVHSSDNMRMPCMHALAPTMLHRLQKNVNKHASTDPDHLHRALYIQAYRHINKHIDLKKSATKSILIVYTAENQNP